VVSDSERESERAAIYIYRGWREEGGMTRRRKEAWILRRKIINRDERELSPMNIDRA